MACGVGNQVFSSVAYMSQCQRRVSIDSNNGLLHIRRQANILTTAWVMLNGLLGKKTLVKF